MVQILLLWFPVSSIESFHYYYQSNLAGFRAYPQYVKKIIRSWYIKSPWYIWGECFTLNDSKNESTVKGKSVIHFLQIFGNSSSALKRKLPFLFKFLRDEEIPLKWNIYISWVQSIYVLRYIIYTSFIRTIVYEYIFA